MGRPMKPEGTAMNMDIVKKWAKNFMEISQGFLMENAYVPTSLYAIDKYGTPTHIELNDEGGDAMTEVNDLMKELAATSEAFVVVIDAHIAEKEPGVDVTEKALKDDPESFKALVAIAITKEETALYQLMYQEENKTYNFMYTGWETVTHVPGTDISNPWNQAA